MITGHHRTDDLSPSELAWQAVKGHQAIAAAVQQHAEEHEKARAERSRQVMAAIADASVRPE